MSLMWCFPIFARHDSSHLISRHLTMHGSVVDVVRFRDRVVWVHVATKLATEFVANYGTSIHVQIRRCIIVDEE